MKSIYIEPSLTQLILQSGRIPSPVRELHDPQTTARFEEYYMRLVTTEFGDDLNSVRMSKDFGDKSLPMLVRALKQGVNIFDADEKRIVVGGVAE
jgi:ribosome assembly protein 3